MLRSTLSMTTIEPADTGRATPNVKGRVTCWAGHKRADSLLVRLLRGRLAMPALIFLGALSVVSVTAGVATPYNPFRQDLANSLRPPSGAHWLGTDQLGRDVLSRLMAGSRISLEVGLLAVGAGLVGGSVLGLIAGYWPAAWSEKVIMRAMDALLAFPQIVLALAISALLGPSVRNAIIAIAVVDVPIFARLVRGQVLGVRELTYVDAARTVGAGSARIIGRHIVPNVMSAVVVVASLRVANAIMVEATLSFLGLGAQPPTATWGSMLADGREVLQQAPWDSISPGIAIFLTVLALNLAGDALRDALDPRLRA
jgi:peptide/nickel transport system permease protein